MTLRYISLSGAWVPPQARMRSPWYLFLFSPPRMPRVDIFHVLVRTSVGDWDWIALKRSKSFGKSRDWIGGFDGRSFNLDWESKIGWFNLSTSIFWIPRKKRLTLSLETPWKRIFSPSISPALPPQKTACAQTPSSCRCMDTCLYFEYPRSL